MTSVIFTPSVRSEPANVEEVIRETASAARKVRTYVETLFSGELADGFKLHFIQQQKANLIRKADEDGVLKSDIIIFPICNLNVKTQS